MSNPITPIWAVVGAIIIVAFYFGGADSKDLGACVAIYALSLTLMVLYSAGKDAEFNEIERWTEGHRQSK